MNSAFFSFFARIEHTIEKLEQVKKGMNVMFWLKCSECKALPLFSGNEEAPAINVLSYCREAIVAGRLNYVTGNCSLEASEKILQAETQYTVVHYFECTKCGQLLLLGFCIRGKPFFKKVEKIEAGLLN